jgi:hypothetical protein
MARTLRGLRREIITQRYIGPRAPTPREDRARGS